MSGINGVGANNPVNKIIAQPIQRQVPSESAQPTPRSADRVELSGNIHQMLSALKTNDVRADKVADVKAQIQAGTYETDEKLEAAIDRMLDDLA